jgi:hypothetical protein
VGPWRYLLVHRGITGSTCRLRLESLRVNAPLGRNWLGQSFSRCGAKGEGLGYRRLVVVARRIEDPSVCDPANGQYKAKLKYGLRSVIEAVFGLRLLGHLEASV